MSNNPSDEPAVEYELLEDDDGRKWIAAAVDKPKFSRDEQVWFNAPGAPEGRGPYLIEQVFKHKRTYTLCMLDGQRFRNGQEISENDLSKAR